MGDECVTQLDVNRLSFVGDINGKNVSKLVALLVECIKQQPWAVNGGKPTVYLHVHSDGGCLHSGFRAYDTIKLLSKRCNIITVAEGHVASSATLLCLAGNKRCALRNTWFLCHQLSSSVSGKNSLIQDEARNCKLMMRQLIRVYTNETSLNRFQVKRLLSKEVNISVEQAKKWGFISSIL